MTCDFQQCGVLTNVDSDEFIIVIIIINTGDIGHVNEKGYFTITDRLKELIKYKGFQVSSCLVVSWNG